MAEPSIQQNSRWYSRRTFFLTLLLLAGMAMSAMALLMPYSAQRATLDLQGGDVAGQDVLAPRALTFESTVLTQERQQEASDAVADVYGPPDANVAREQVEQLRQALNFINIVRLDEFATTEQKLADLTALQNINLGQDNALELLSLNESGWQSVQQESIAVLEQIMRSTIRQNRLEEARRSVPALVSLSLPQSQAALAAALAEAFVAPNSFFSESLTAAAKAEAAAAVEPVTRSFLNDEVIVQRGQVVAEADLEALEVYGLIQPELRWQDYVGVTTLVVALTAFSALYIRREKELTRDLRGLSLVIILFIFFLFAARVLVTNRTVLPYIFPLAGFGLLVTTLYSSSVAIVLSIVLGVLAAYGLNNAFELTLFYIFGSLAGILILRRTERMITYFWAGAAVALAGVVVLMAYRLPLASTDLIGIVTLFAASLLNGFASATVTIVLQLLLAQFLGLTTTIQLLELARPDHPLLQFILRNAPGTYQHSLLIANLSEQAAEAIEADALLTRIGSLYHDAGKARHPHFFIENQVPGSPNPHDEMSPLESAQTIIRHVPDGLELANKHRLPRRIKDFIAEHHGTMLTRYQYAQAAEAAGSDEDAVDSEDFRYPGPRPQTRETALVMLADGCEARTRAERPETREELNALVNSVIEHRLSHGQLDDTLLTMQDLKVIQDSFVSTLRGVYHPRLQYPKLDEKPVESLDVQPPVESLNTSE